MSEDMVTILPEVNEVIREQLKRLRCKQNQSRPELKPLEGTRLCNKCKRRYPVEDMVIKQYSKKRVWICALCSITPDRRLSRK